MQNLTTNEIRQIWLDYFEKHGHFVLESKSLIPVNDRSLIWINSGIATLKPFFSGQANPPCNRLVNCQKAIRTNDIENVGKTSRHHTFFEMLGNFSIGDYFKKQAIYFAYDLLVNVYQLDKQKLYITVFEQDLDAKKYWLELGIVESKILLGNKDRNFWDVGNGPCGPCTEIFYDRGIKFDPNNIGEKLFFEDIENDRYVEIWNVVFSQYNNDGQGNYTELSRKNIDTGAGLERLACVMQDTFTNFDIDIYIPIIKEIENHTDKKYISGLDWEVSAQQKEINYAFRVIADHLKACAFAIADGAIPGNKDRGYIIRRLLRRAMIFARKIGVKDNFIGSLVEVIISQMKHYYPYLIRESKKIVDVLTIEENTFNKTLSAGLKLFHETINEASKKDNKQISSHKIFDLVTTYGFPKESIDEETSKYGLKYSQSEYEMLFKKHQEVSKSDNTTKAMAKQNSDLMNLHLESVFDYDKLETNSKVIAIFDQDFKSIDKITHNGKYWLVFNKTCIYANSGGQIADSATIIINNVTYEVIDAIKGPNGQHLHEIETINNESIFINETAHLKVDELKRQIISAHHSIEHLIHIALKKIVDPNIKQEGASKTVEKVSFDFQYHQKLTDNQLRDIENQINQWIDQSIDVETHIQNLQQAKQMGAIAYFENVYSKVGEKLRVVKMGEVSCEICGGTHVKNLSEIQQFHILRLTAKGSGSWRIEAFGTNYNTNIYLNHKKEAIKQTVKGLKENLAKYKIVDNRINSNLDDLASADDWYQILDDEKQLAQLSESINELLKTAKFQFDGNIIREYVDFVKNNLSGKPIDLIKFTDADTALLMKSIPSMLNEIKDRTLIILNILKDKIVYIVCKNEKLNSKHKANEICMNIAKLTNSKGGGREFFAQGSCLTNDENLNLIENFVASLR